MAASGHTIVADDTAESDLLGLLSSWAASPLGRADQPGHDRRMLGHRARPRPLPRDPGAPGTVGDLRREHIEAFINDGLDRLTRPPVTPSRAPQFLRLADDDCVRLRMTPPASRRFRISTRDYDPYPESNCCRTLPRSESVTTAPRSMPSLYSLPGLIHRVRPIFTVPRDSWI